MFYVLLYRSRIVPRWISAWGLVAIPLYLAAHLLAMHAVIGVASTEQTFMFMPMLVQELVLAVSMIARGFRPAAVATTPEVVNGTLVGAKRSWVAPTWTTEPLPSTRGHCNAHVRKSLK